MTIRYEGMNDIRYDCFSILLALDTHLHFFSNTDWLMEITPN